MSRQSVVPLVSALTKAITQPAAPSKLVQQKLLFPLPLRDRFADRVLDAALNLVRP